MVKFEFDEKEKEQIIIELAKHFRNDISLINYFQYNSQFRDSIRDKILEDLNTDFINNIVREAKETFMDKVRKESEKQIKDISVKIYSDIYDRLRIYIYEEVKSQLLQKSLIQIEENK